MRRVRQVVRSSKRSVEPNLDFYDLVSLGQVTQLACGHVFHATRGKSGFTFMSFESRASPPSWCFQCFSSRLG